MILFMVLIGSFIGGLTNYVAIKMLFQPHQPKYIGKWRVPFTPGVIPKRRDQLAKQLGSLVINHLVTVDSIQLKVQDPVLKQNVEEQVIKEWDYFLQQTTRINQLPVSLEPNLLKEHLAQRIVDHINGFVEKHRQDKLGSFIDLLVDEEDVRRMADLVQNKLMDIVAGEETQQKMEEIIQDYAVSKGFFGRMLLSMFSGDELAEKIQRLVINYIQSPQGKEWIQHTTKKEWQQLLEQRIDVIGTFFKKEQTQEIVRSFVQEQLPLEQWLDTPIQDLLQPLSKQVKEQVIPQAIDGLFDHLSQQIPKIMQQLEVEKMVENQVASFPIKRVEELVLSITRKEFSLITYLGVFLGGMIGFIQAILLLAV